MKSSITLTLSKIYAILITIMGFILTYKESDSLYFSLVIPIGAGLIGWKQWNDKNKKLE